MLLIHLQIGGAKENAKVHKIHGWLVIVIIKVTRIIVVLNQTLLINHMTMIITYRVPNNFRHSPLTKRLFRAKSTEQLIIPLIIAMNVMTVILPSVSGHPVDEDHINHLWKWAHQVRGQYHVENHNPP